MLCDCSLNCEDTEMIKLSYNTYTKFVQGVFHFRQKWTMLMIE